MRSLYENMCDNTPKKGQRPIVCDKDWLITLTQERRNGLDSANMHC